VTDGPRVALTFDAEHPDRPTCPPDAPQRILDALAEAGVRATFFIQGRWALAYPETAQRVARDGHLVGNHSMFHARMSLLSDDGLRTDIRESAEAIQEVMGVDPRPWFRTPFGDGRDDPRVLAAIEELGYRNMHWGVEPLDWDPPTTAGDIVARTLAGVAELGDGAVVLLHTWPASTAAAVGPLIAAMRAAGIRFATLDEVAA
jgi:peptidoglycan/xylan/chitin deacetylase (PgdA/CDA1 family)